VVERPSYLKAADYIRAEQQRIERQSADDDDPGALVDDFFGAEGQEVFNHTLRAKFGEMARAESVQAAYSCLLDRDVDRAREHVARALECHKMLREAADFGGFSMPDGALETAAGKHRISPTDARVWRTKNSLWAEFWMDVGRLMERRKHSGQKPDLETFLAGLDLVAQAELMHVSLYGLLKSMPDEKEARKLEQGARRAQQRMQEWISATAGG
jgi:hypothetical protein